MRFILALAAGAAALAIGTAAQSGPRGAGGGKGASGPVAISYGPGHYSGRGNHPGYSPGGIRGDRHHGRRHGRFGRGDLLFYGGSGIVGPVGEVDPNGNGFFAGGGGRIRLRGGQPYFDYDRSYPYEWSSTALRSEEHDRADEARATQPGPRCTFEAGVRVCRGW